MRTLGFPELVRLLSTECILHNMEKEWPQLATVIKHKPIAAVHAINENGVIENALRGIYNIQWNFYGEEFPELVYNIKHDRMQYKLLNQPVVKSDDEFKDFIGDPFNHNNEKKYQQQHKLKERNDERYPQQYQQMEINDDTSQVSDTVLDLIRKFVLNAVIGKYSKKEQNNSRFAFNTRDRFELHERDFYNDNDTCIYWQANGWIEVKDESVASWMRRVTFVGKPEVFIIVFQLKAMNKLEQRVSSLGVADSSEQFENDAIKDGVLCDSIDQILL